MGVLVVGVGPMLVACDDDSRNGPEGDPALSPPPYGVVRARDAVDAVEGEDYDLVHELTPSEGQSTVAVLPDGRLVALASEDHDSYDGAAFVLELVDAASGDREQLPAPWRDEPEAYPLVTVLEDARLLVSWDVREQGASTRRSMVLDLATGDHEEFDMPAPPLSARAKVLSYPQPDADGRLWFQTGKQTCGDGECFSPRDAVLWSYAPGDERPRRELAAVDFAVHGDLLAWTDDRYDDKVHVRDLSSGAEHEHAVDGKCGVTGLVASDALVVAVCGLDYGRQVVLDRRARPVADLRLSYEYASVGDRWVLISPFAYDTWTGRLLRLFHRGSGADPTRELTDDLAVVPLGEANVVGTFAHWGVLRLRSAR